MPVKQLRLLVIIINYKTPQLVCQAIQSVIPQIDTYQDKICIVDNNSKDDSVAVLQEFQLKHDLRDLVDIIESPINGGFSAGNNVGVLSQEAEYYLLLNSDAYLSDNALTYLLEAMESSLKMGIVAPRLNWQNGMQQTSCFCHLTPFNSFLNSAKTGAFSRLLKPLAINEVAIPLEQHDIVDPQWLSFACVLIRATMIKEIGLMDEGYFMYREDNDYCRRATQSGWQLKYVAQAHVVHLNQGSSNQKAVKRLPKYYFQSRTRYFLKYYGRPGLVLANLLWTFGRCISLLRELIEGKPQVFHSRMWLDIWAGFLIPLKRR